MPEQDQGPHFFVVFFVCSFSSLLGMGYSNSHETGALRCVQMLRCGLPTHAHDSHRARHEEKATSSPPPLSLFEGDLVWQQQTHPGYTAFHGEVFLSSSVGRLLSFTVSSTPRRRKEEKK